MSGQAARVETTAAAPAEAGTKLPSRISVFSSDDRVDSGEQFVLRGRMFSRGKPVSGATVRVRIILSSAGKRILRVVGDARGDRIRIARATTEVRVLG